MSGRFASDVFQPVKPALDVPALEREVADRWRREDTEARYLVRNADSERRFSFLDGPITANNPMGVHHAWGRTYKDLYQRYHTMLGEQQRYQNGFDCQGLWVEVEVEKELGFTTKRDIEAYGIDRVRRGVQGARPALRRRITEQTIRLGYWMDWDNSYFTMLGREQLHDLGLPQDAATSAAGLQGPRRHALVPALRHRLSEHEIVTEGYQELHPPALTIRLPTPSCASGQASRCWSGRRRRGRWPQRRRRRAPGPDLRQLVAGTDGDRCLASVAARSTRVAP